jgi:hypothetical protein
MSLGDLGDPCYVFTFFGILLTVVGMIAERWKKWIAYVWVVPAFAAFGLSLYEHSRTVPIVVMLSPEEKVELGRPYDVDPKDEKDGVYQGLYARGVVVWVDEYFYLLPKDQLSWHRYKDTFRATGSGDPWFSKSALKKLFPLCEDRLPIGGIAKSMKGDQSYLYTWLGCLDTPSSHSHSDREQVQIQRFEKGIVIEGIVNPPQSTTRERFILRYDAGWNARFMDSNGTFTPAKYDP